MSIENLAQYFHTIEDPRCSGKVEHRLRDILVIAVCAVIACADSWDDIALYGRSKLAWLRTFLELPNGIPSFHRRKARGRAADRGPLAAQELLAPRVDLARADPMLAGNLGRRQVRTKALADNRQLLLGRPRAPTLSTRQNLHTWAANTCRL